LGHDYNPLWLQAWHGGPPWFPDVFGISGIGTGAPGGFDGFENRPNLNIFGAAPSISMGFTMVLIPEPTSVGLGALGLAMFLWRRVGKARANTDYI
jgi:hypothetical protein